MQNAITIPEKFGQFTSATRPIPTPGPRELLIKVQAVALNPIDWKNRKYSFLLDQYPAVVGWDTAGDVIAVGEGVTRFSIGDRV
jgi:NADPH:quinone reductase-like Zn-dependent oxidoreductase